MAEITDELKDNYRRIRAERDCTWEAMAQQFERDGDQTVATSVMRDPSEHRALAAWARSEAAEEPKPAPAKATPPRRDARQQPPARTA